MKKTMLDIRHLFDEFKESDIPEILNVLIAAGHIGTALRRVPDDERLNIQTTLREALQNPQSDLNGMGRLVIEASVKISEDASFLKRMATDLENHFNSSP